MTGSAFTADVYQPHVRAVMRVALSLAGGDRQQAEDIAQETMLRAWKNRETLDGRQVRSWLCRVARNIAVDLHRRRESRGAREAAAARDVLTEDATARLLGIPAGTVKSRASHAIAALREALAEASS